MSGSEIGVSIFAIILGLLTVLMAFKYNKNFHHNYVHTRLGSDEEDYFALIKSHIKKKRS
ncbi:hypothetical protein [Bacillus cereus]|uniref:Uncharacterized protein n=1 Tax=Bacillus cereus TaxID=1396 RepID=A0A9X7B5B0_BACCE|nr:hypothetical protein [Bacillus cereus]PED41889.1 hypothetical protein CON26_22620 [Bacillus cereus]PFU99722.1 hypothetical protein COK98_32110 [Bacillus cereus]